MSISSLRWRLALVVVVAAAAAVVALAVPAGASTGSGWISPEQAGYVATGARFRDIHAHVYLRNLTQYAGMARSFGHSVQLWSSSVVVTVGVKASTSGKSYAPYATIYDRSTHQVIASNPNADRCVPYECHPGTGAPFPVGRDLYLVISYLAGGEVGMAVGIPIPGSGGYTIDVGFSYLVGPQSFTQARVGTEFGSSPWDASYKYTPPAISVKVAAYNNVKLTTYSGRESGLRSWWVHHKLLANTGQERVAVPHSLYKGGASFQTWFVPEARNDPASRP